MENGPQKKPMTNEIEEFMDEFNDLLKKYAVDDVILINFDDNEMGYRQLMKFTKDEEKKYLVMSFSGKDETLCPCCKGKESHQ